MRYAHNSARRFSGSIGVLIEWRHRPLSGAGKPGAREVAATAPYAAGLSFELGNDTVSRPHRPAEPARRAAADRGVLKPLRAPHLPVASTREPMPGSNADDDPRETRTT